MPDELFKAVSDYGEYGFLDRENKELLIPFVCDYVDEFSEGMAMVVKIGFIDKTGRWVEDA